MEKVFSMSPRAQRRAGNFTRCVTKNTSKSKAEPESQEPVEEWAVTEQVQDALQEAHGFLLAIAERKIA
eukprot:symbB.v1.2.030423.t1/scaffold3428.1/size56978/2